MAVRWRVARAMAHSVVCAAVAVAGTGLLRRWCDGSLQEDLPMRCLSEMFGVNFFMVSQCNPWLLPILAARQALPVRLREIAELEVKHRCEQLLQLFPGRKMLRLIAQPWRGDLNFVLPLSTFPLLRSAVNFTAEEMTRAMREVRSRLLDNQARPGTAQ